MNAQITIVKEWKFQIEKNRSLQRILVHTFYFEDFNQSEICNLCWQNPVQNLCVKKLSFVLEFKVIAKRYRIVSALVKQKFVLPFVHTGQRIFNV